MSKLDEGERFPEIILEGAEGPEALAERWQRGPLVVAFERHFG